MVGDPDKTYIACKTKVMIVEPYDETRLGLFDHPTVKAAFSLIFKWKIVEAGPWLSQMNETHQRNTQRKPMMSGCRWVTLDFLCSSTKRPKLLPNLFCNIMLENES